MENDYSRSSKKLQKAPKNNTADGYVKSFGILNIFVNFLRFAVTGYNIDAVERLKLEKSPTEALLMEWGTAENATLNTLMEALKAMRREDVYSQLQKVLGFHSEGFDQVIFCFSSVSIFKWLCACQLHPYCPANCFLVIAL